MLYKIESKYTKNNFSTKINEKLSSNDQYYAAQLYMNNFEKDYEHCEKDISCEDKNRNSKLQCYNTWYKHCMEFVRDFNSCKSYKNSEAEYEYWLWVKNQSEPMSCPTISKHHYILFGIDMLLVFSTI